MSNIAEIIYQQIGGRQFRLMTGSRDFINLGTALRMTLIPNRSGANRLEIRYNEGSDLYTMRFYRHSSERLNLKTGKRTDAKDTIKAEYEDVYCDQLAELFTQVTGLDTIMPHFAQTTQDDQ